MPRRKLKREKHKSPFLIRSRLVQQANGAWVIQYFAFQLRPRAVRPHEIRLHLPIARVEPSPAACEGKALAMVLFLSLSNLGARHGKLTAEIISPFRGDLWIDCYPI